MQKTVGNEAQLFDSVSYTYRPTFIDIFAGCGGLSLGLMQAGWDGAFAIEQDVNAFSTLNENLLDESTNLHYSWPNWLPKTAQSVGDVLQKYQVELAALEGKIDMLVGGPPCQGFSNAGRRDPADPRNKLVEAYLEFVDLIKPKIVLIENVKGITQDFDEIVGNEGKVNYSQRIIKSLSEKYFVSSRMIDTSTFGVPQKRVRFFIIAISQELEHQINASPFDAIELDRLTFLNSKGIHTVPVSSRSAISDLEISRNGRVPSRDSHGFEEIAYIGPLTSYQRLMHDDLGDSPSDTRLARHRVHIVDRFKEIIESCQAEGRLSISLSAKLKARFGLRKSAIRVLDPEKPSPTITSMPDDLIHYQEPRTLTVRENARIQSFPDWFVFKGKYTTGGTRRKKEVPRFTQVANAVPPLVAEAIGRTLAHRLYAIQLAIKNGSNLQKDLRKNLGTLEVPS